MAEPQYVVILAARKSEGYTYAKRAGIPARQCRIPIRAGQLGGLRRAQIHILPSFQTAPQRHAILSALRAIRGPGVSLLTRWVEMPAPTERPATDQGDGMGEQMTLEDLMAQIEADEAALAEKQAAYAEMRAERSGLPPFSDDVQQDEAALEADRMIAAEMQQVDPLQDLVDQGLVEPADFVMPGTLEEYVEGHADDILQQAANEGRYRLERAATIAFRYESIMSSYDDTDEMSSNDDIGDEPNDGTHPVRQAKPEDKPVEDDLPGMWEQADLIGGQTDAGDDDPVAPVVKTGRRRSRCPECGELRFPEDHECVAATPDVEPASTPPVVADPNADFF